MGNKEVETKSIGYRELFKELQYMKSLTASLITRFGDSIDSVAYAWLVYEITGSAATIALIYAMSSLPSLLFGLVSGAIVSYFPKKVVIFISDIGRGFFVLITAILYLSGNLQTWHLFLFAFLNSTFEAFRGPASSAQMVTLLPREKIPFAMGLSTSAARVAELGGLGIVGFLIATIGIAGVIIIDAVTFFICGVIILTVKNKADIIKKETITVRGVIVDFKEGFSYFKSHKILLYITIMSSLIMLCAIPINSMMAPYVSEVLKSGPEMMSLISITFAVSMLIAGIGIPKIMTKVKRINILSSGGIIIGIGYCGLSFLGGAPKALVPIMIIILTGSTGAGVVALNMITGTVFHQKTDREYMARVASLFNSFALCTTPIGSVIVSGLCLFLNIEQLFMVFSISLTLIFIAVRFNKVFKEDLE
ncbi:MAG: MFS transporter [Sarcina sp.]